MTVTNISRSARRTCCCLPWGRGKKKKKTTFPGGSFATFQFMGIFQSSLLESHECVSKKFELAWRATTSDSLFTWSEQQTPEKVAMQTGLGLLTLSYVLETQYHLPSILSSRKIPWLIQPLFKVYISLISNNWSSHSFSPVHWDTAIFPSA